MLNLKVTSKYGFDIDWIGRADSKIEHSTLVQFRNKEFEDIINDNNIDFHYELHISKKCAFIRLDCHCAPYGEYKNKSKEEYTQLAGEDRVKARKKFSDKFRVEFQNYKFKRYYYNYLALIKKDLNMGSDILPQILSFIDETYEKSLDIIKSVLL